MANIIDVVNLIHIPLDFRCFKMPISIKVFNYIFATLTELTIDLLIECWHASLVSVLGILPIPFTSHTHLISTKFVH